MKQTKRLQVKPTSHSFTDHLTTTRKTHRIRFSKTFRLQVKRHPSTSTRSGFPDV